MKKLGERAFRVETPGFSDLLYFADSRAKAKFMAYSDARDAGYTVKFDDFRVTRWPEHDNMTTRPRKGHGIEV